MYSVHCVDCPRRYTNQCSHCRSFVCHVHGPVHRCWAYGSSWAWNGIARVTESCLGQAEQYAELVRLPALDSFMRCQYAELHPNELDALLGQRRAHNALLCGFILHRVGAPHADPFVGPRTLVQAALFGNMEPASILYAAYAAIGSMRR